MNRLVKALLDTGVRVRSISSREDERAAVWGLIEDAFVRERGYLRSLQADIWDSVSHFYVLTSHGKPSGCLRIVDPARFPQQSAELPRRFGRVCLPIEAEFALDGHVVDTCDFFEPGRNVVSPELRNKGAFVALAATAYLYALHNQKRGAVCLASSEVVEPYLKMGWQRLSEPFTSTQYTAPAHPMLVWTDNVNEKYAALFLEMEQCGVIDI